MLGTLLSLRSAVAGADGDGAEEVDQGDDAGAEIGHVEGQHHGDHAGDEAQQAEGDGAAGLAGAGRR